MIIPVFQEFFQLCISRIFDYSNFGSKIYNLLHGNFVQLLLAYYSPNYYMQSLCCLKLPKLLLLLACVCGVDFFSDFF